MGIPTHAKVIEDVDAYIQDKGLNPNTFGKMCLNDTGAIPRLKKGSDPRLSTVLKIYQFIKGRK